MKNKVPTVNDSPEGIVDGRLDMVMAFDTTCPMPSYIGAVKGHVKEPVDDAGMPAVYVAYSKKGQRLPL